MPENPRIEALRRRVEADPTTVAFAALAEQYRRAGRYAEAIQTCRRGLQHFPAYVSARVTLGRALIEMGRLEEAKAELRLVLGTAPENLAAIRGLADIRHRQATPTGPSDQTSAARNAASREPVREALEAFLQAILSARAARARGAAS